ncbi:RNA degradosome polyphosphate kinase [Bacillus sp. DJP31]|uniref:RNA degradosome polyphosphate kinase n=1 Tax=Bacillus sp. DJP31 TaxID=3409789 RepID=UPI003BB4B2F7
MVVKNEERLQLENPKFYNNRELSWLAFNKRVLEEAIDINNPLFERLNFLSIFSSNLDEFFMVRVAGLKDQVKVGFKKPENKAGLTPKNQLNRISIKTHELVHLQYQCFNNLLIKPLEDEGITFTDIDSLSTSQKRYLEELFDDQIFPVLTPLAVDAYRPFPMLLNKSLNIAVFLEDEEEVEENRNKLAIVQVPSVIDRFIVLPGEQESHHIVLLENLISYFIHKLFRGYKVNTLTHFRITRNADMTIHEEGARDLLKEIEKELKKRKWGTAVRLEVTKEGLDENILSYLLDVLEIHEKDVYKIEGPLDLSFMFSFTRHFGAIKEHLTFPTLIPQPPKDLNSDEDIFEKVLDQDVFLHHPYESFEPVLDLVEEAAENPNVLAIKQTLYRVSGDSPVIDALKRAAGNGKQVTVLVELKARFDEENNVQWAKELEKAGCHVIYGMTQLKTHSKITLIVSQKNGRIERFVHLGTGNYNDQTAKIYTDMGLITSKRKFGIDATNFFNYLSGYTEIPDFHHLSISPFDMKKKFIELIQQEIHLQQKFNNGRIIAKMNSLTDKALIMKFYEASKAGVKIDLIVRGICCLRPGIPGVSDNIRVRSIVGRFLEHSRIYYFYHNGEERTYLSSADMMTRNMEKRVEILFPIFEDSIKKRIAHILEIQLSDNVKARVQDPFGDYSYVQRSENEPDLHSQMVLYEQAYRVLEDEE